ncbi:MAG: toll/interleukin-1 receptor domain-containing protein, partial [Bacteroidales bacterium]|nr:toll/interleukin-1 receptor domain-containing protein [Bacteroidales bacterium]
MGEQMSNTAKKHSVFISWHNDKDASKEIAEEIGKFMKYVFHDTLDVFVSSQIADGLWRERLKEEFKNCDFAIFLFTADASNSLWVNAEYGAFYMKSTLLDIDNLFGNLAVFMFPKETDLNTKSPVIQDVQKISLYDKALVRSHFDNIEKIASVLNKKEAKEIVQLDVRRFEDDWNVFDKHIKGFREEGINYLKKYDSDGVYGVDKTSAEATLSAPLPVFHRRNASAIVTRENV